MAKKLGLVALILVAGVFAVLYYYWSQLTNVPEWYTSEGENTSQLIDPNDTQAIEATKEEVTQKITTQVQEQLGEEEIEIKLHQEDVNDLLVTSIAENPQGNDFLQSAKGVNTTITDDSIEIGAVVNTGELAEQDKSFEQAMEQLPLLKNRDIYVAIEGSPEIENGQLQFDENTRIKVGNLSMTVTEASQRLGIPQEKIQQYMAVKLGESGLNDIELNDEEIVFRTQNQQ